MLEKLGRVRSDMQTRFHQNSPLSGNSTGNFVISGFFEQNELEYPCAGALPAQFPV
jgi:hypothetical protein